MSEVNCGGYCCERFRFGNNYSPEWWKERLSKDYATQEERQIGEMIVYLGEAKTDSDGEEGVLTHWYTCKHFDTTTRLCKIYEERPRMCRDYNTKPWSPCGLKQCKMPKPEYPPETEVVEKKLEAAP